MERTDMLADARADDEVFVSVRYEPADFVRMRRVALLARARETNAPQAALFVALAAVAALFLAPDPLGRILASAGGALVAMIGLLVGWGLVRAGRPAPLPIEEASVEVSDTGFVVKSNDHYARARWRDFAAVAEGLGVFVCIGETAIVLPKRALRDDQVEVLRTLRAAHASEIGSGSDSPR